MHRIQIDVSESIIEKSIRDCHPDKWHPRENFCAIALATKIGIKSVIHRNVLTTVQAEGGFKITVGWNSFRVALPPIAKKAIKDFDMHLDRSGPLPKPLKFNLNIPDKYWDVIAIKK